MRDCDPKFKDFLLFLVNRGRGMPNPETTALLLSGHPDHFTEYTTFLALSAEHNQMTRKMYCTLDSLRVEFERAHPELLISNPCSVNLRSPHTTFNVIRRDLEEILVTVTKDKDLAIFSNKSKERDIQSFSHI
jgi:hypothetical protein